MTEALFGLAFVVAVAAWFFAIIEMIAVHSFWTAFFRFGIPALKETLEIDTKDLSVHLTGQSKKMKENSSFPLMEKSTFFLSSLCSNFA